MMRNGIFRVFVLFAALLVLSGVSFGQGGKAEAEIDKNLALLRKDLRSGKKQLFALNLPLSETEAVKFWPVYDQFSAELSGIYDARVLLIKEYAANIDSLTDATAADLTRRSIDNDGLIIKLRQKYQPIIAKVLPGKKAALFFQLDRRIGLLVDLQVASEIPLVAQ